MGFTNSIARSNGAMQRDRICGPRGEKQPVLSPQYRVKPVPDLFDEARARLGKAAVF